VKINECGASQEKSHCWNNELTMTVEPQQQQQQRPRRSLYNLDVCSIILILFGLYWFAASFFLAKRSLSQYGSDCHEAAHLLQERLGLTAAETTLLKRQGVLAQDEILTRNGCWMERRVDSLVVLLVDALRFDFAYYNLPLSIGKRIRANGANNVNNSSRLFQFVADPPTVTMQRLKALTTGGLPTFADISANFGGATVEDDSWVKLLRNTDYRSRGLQFAAQTGFVGDDTWEDLFPGYFTESHPYPSFNTRDLNTVDNGCLKHLPNLLQELRTTGDSAFEMEVEVVHFLGVDHVGHTYGPHNEHMDAKLREMDAALATVLELLDQQQDSCHAALIFGDHGMTEDGNHGGGTPEETHAALFVHASPACGARMNSGALFLETSSSSEWVEETLFASIHQIDLVPTIAVLLGLPIPYANLGGLVPSLLPGQDIRQMTASLALNAAQVWRYFTVYSATANRLPDMPELKERLQLAVAEYKEALGQDDAFEVVTNADKYIQAATLFKNFLTEALELGQRVWTRFDDVGMVSGIAVLLVGLIIYCLPLFSSALQQYKHIPVSQYWEIIATAVFVIVYLCGMLTFSNSYILEEEDSIMYCLSILSILLSLRLQSDPAPSTLWRDVIFLPVASRLNELFVSGHGLDPSIRLHIAHSAPVFMTSLAILVMFRWYLYRTQITRSLWHTLADCATLVAVAASWWEKRALDPDRNGYVLCRVALVLLGLGIPTAILQILLQEGEEKVRRPTSRYAGIGDAATILAKVAIFTMTVAGPATAASLVIYTFQASVIYRLTLTTGAFQASSLVVAALWRLVSRHAFFATNHGCFFNRLQYSAAFVATKEFYFVTGGISLFFNTFGWELLGITFAYALSQTPGRAHLMRIYAAFQLVEALTSCISVSLLRRHLMVWDIYAPHFLFAAIYTVLNMFSQLTAFVLSGL